MESNVTVKIGKDKDTKFYGFIIVSEQIVKPSKLFMNRIVKILKNKTGSLIFYDIENFEYYTDIIELDVIKGEILRWSIIDQSEGAI